tara:strand:- start:120 stop:305 length:186 start_codon:yes stop_codon:yes gene_type:complete
MLIKFMMATICLPLIAIETGEVVTATQLELKIMEHINAEADVITEQDLMMENCYEITIAEK